MQQLLAGYARFKSQVFAQHSRHFAELTYSQEPQALFITCSDSRVMPEMMMQCVPGQIVSLPQCGKSRAATGRGDERCCGHDRVRSASAAGTGHHPLRSFRLLRDACSARRGKAERPAACSLLAVLCRTDGTCFPRRHAGPASVADGGAAERTDGAERACAIAEPAVTPVRCEEPQERQPAHPWLGVRHTDGRDPLSRSAHGEFSASAAKGSVGDREPIRGGDGRLKRA